MNYANIVDCDLANGTGVRVSVFVCGCTHHCKGCFNPEAWDFNFGSEFTEETQRHIISLLSKPYITGLTILGGEPLEPENQVGLIGLLRAVKSEMPTKDVWCYTGYTIEQLVEDGSKCRCEVTDELLSLIDVLVDGEFNEELKDASLKFRGSSNQRIINMRDWHER